MTVDMFFDAQALWYGATRGHDARVNYSALRDHILAGRTMGEAHVFLSDRANLDSFESALRHMGFFTIVLPRGALIDQRICAAARLSTAKTIAIAAGQGNYSLFADECRDNNKVLEFYSFRANRCQWRNIHTMLLGASVVQAAEG